MSSGRPADRAIGQVPLALGVVGVGGLAVAAVVLSLRSAPRRSELVPAPAPSLPPAVSVAEPRDAAPPQPQWTEEDDVVHDTLAAQREALLGKLVKFQDYSPEAIDEIRKIMAQQPWLGQGNPKCTKHPMSRAECRAIRRRAKVVAGDPERCGRKNMVPIYDPTRGQTAADADVCIDQFEFPNIACEYPVTWVRANVAERLCEIQGKRLCDAHEWEGACAGAVLPAKSEYAWGIRPYEDIETQRIAMQHAHNANREVVWAYGKTKDHKKCATRSRKNTDCITPSWEKCGTNTYPAGAFPECVSPFGVYDLHGNVAEHMNYPMAEDQLARYGKLGQTEMKGSWFIFDTYEAHPDDCRWRAPDWHAGPVMSESSHMNYHLGFRCCRDLKPVERITEERAPEKAPAAEPEHLATDTERSELPTPQVEAPVSASGGASSVAPEPLEDAGEVLDETGARSVEPAPAPARSGEP